MQWILMSACDNNNSCNSRFRLPCGLIDILNQPLKNPTGRWTDFNPMVNRFIKLQAQARGNRNPILCEDDLANPPQIGDYSNLTLARTRTDDAPTCS